MYVTAFHICIKEASKTKRNINERCIAICHSCAKNKHTAPGTQNFENAELHKSAILLCVRVRHLFICHQLGLNQLIFICTKLQDCFLITDRFQVVRRLSMLFFTFLSSCMISHCYTECNLDCYRHQALRNIFTKNIGDVFNTYFTRCV